MQGGTGLSERSAVRELGAADPANRAAQPELSIILPLVEHRGHALASVRSWATGQSHARSAIELVVLSDGSEPRLDASVRALLAEHDQFVIAAGASLMALLHSGAERARGAVLLFTEAHCEAERGAGAAVLHHLAERGVDGVSLGTVSRSRNHLARMEDRMFARHMAPMLAPEHWYKIMLRAFAIRRDCYFAAGGLRPELGLFAEPAFAMALHRLGRPIEIIDTAKVIHHSNTKWRSSYGDVQSHARGQCAFRAASPAEYSRYLGALPEWRHRGGASARFARSAWSDCVAAAATADGWGARRLAAMGVAQLTPAVALGRHAPAFPIAARLGAAALRRWFWRWHGARRDRAFDDVHRRMVLHARMRAVLDFPASPPRPIGIGRVAAPDLADEDLFGFYSAETIAAGTFRWSAPMALIPLDLAPGRYAITFETRGVRWDLGDGALAAALNGRALPSAAIAIGADAVSLDLVVDASLPRPQRLLLLCAPLRKPRNTADRRPLGLPVFSIAIAPARHGTPSSGAVHAAGRAATGPSGVPAL